MRGAHIVLPSLPDLLDLDPRAPGRDHRRQAAPAIPAPRPAGRPGSTSSRREIERPVDWSRVHFVGNLPYDQFVKVLQVSSAHVYMTYPFVLSWSLDRVHGAGMPDRGLGYRAGARDHHRTGSTGACSPSSTSRRWPSGCARRWRTRTNPPPWRRRRAGSRVERNTITRPSACRNGARFLGDLT